MLTLHSEDKCETEQGYMPLVLLVTQRANSLKLIKPIEFFIPSSCQKDNFELSTPQVFKKDTTFVKGLKVNLST